MNILFFKRNCLLLLPQATCGSWTENWRFSFAQLWRQLTKLPLYNRRLHWFLVMQDLLFASLGVGPHKMVLGWDIQQQGRQQQGLSGGRNYAAILPFVIHILITLHLTKILKFFLLAFFTFIPTGKFDPSTLYQFIDVCRYSLKRSLTQ